MAEAKLSKLKVTELKELLVKHKLPQTGKKEDLVKRLVDAGVTGDDHEEQLVALPEEETLAEPPAAAPPVAAVPAAPAPAPAVAAPAEPAAAAAPAAAETPASAPAAETDAEAEPPLTEEEKKQKARAERFGTVWVRQLPKPAKAAPAPVAAKVETAAPARKEKPGAIDRSAGLGISEDVLARRAAKFGVVEKKAPAAAPPAVEEVAKVVAVEEKKVELTPEQVAQREADEEKKRKRAEKWGISKPTTDGEAPDAKKAKV